MAGGKASKGHTAMKHAVAICEGLGYKRIQKSGKRVIYAGPGRILALPEDLFGCFDIIAITPPLPTLLVQVTTEVKGTGSSSAHRRQKIMDKFMTGLDAMPSEVVTVWSWVRQTYMRRWDLDVEIHPGTFEKRFVWREQEELKSPLIKTRLVPQTRLF